MRLWAADRIQTRSNASCDRRFVYFCSLGFLDMWARAALKFIDTFSSGPL